MRVLLSAALQPSHFFPLVPTAWALRAAGHDVRVAHQPRLAPFVQAAGLTSAVVGPDTEIDADRRREAQKSQAAVGPAEGTGGEATRPSDAENRHHIRIALSLFADSAEQMTGGLLDLCRDWRPDLIVFEWQSYAAHLVAEVLGIPSVRHQFSGPDFEAGIKGWREMERDSLLALYREYGVDDVRPDGHATVDPCPPVLQVDLPADRTYLPVRFIPYNGSGRLQEWMYRRSQRPRVALTVGSSYLWMTGNLSPVQRFAELLSRMDVDVIAAVPQGGAKLLGDLPDNIRLAENVPLELFLPSCDAIISHGGTGTVGTSLAHGVPQILTPPRAMGDPPFHNAERIVASGAGVQVDVQSDPDERIVDAIETVVQGHAYRTAALGLARSEEERPLPLELVGDLEELARL
ncbi:DUF1205 domain-containing protein [Streptomonospora sp. PA3]|uniref:nucleotide disphospho-sugar-binding domain-containing protein n=1 Tax=Streptomonospora sp. PA3 TaxID=2607326 RepID=UPI0012DF67E6|nr:nucleotide disphospho-sugar-binding domain-containing protein [Streptomonospora sp. PA3]MUL41470.1 DUF1205 domain-containing protein [Streptomonospora sp. PA3]